MLIFYVIFFFLIVRFSITLFNFISNPKLPSFPRPYTDLVSILIPARNEESNIIELLQSIKQQDYENFEVIILDDDSSDNTYQICSDFCGQHNQFSIIKGNKLSEGWNPKNFACHQLSSNAKGKYLLFIDASLTLKDGLINNSIHRMKLGHLAFLSLFSNRLTRSISEMMVVPLEHFLLLNLLPLRLVKLYQKPSFTAASSQFMLFDATNYHAHLWHAQVKDRIAGDIEIMKLIKAYGYKTETLLANGYLFSKPDKSYFGLINDFSKTFLSKFGNNVAALICYLLLVILGPVFIAVYLNQSLLFFACTLIILSRVMISLLSGQNPLLNVLFHPLQMVSLVLISLLSIQQSISRKMISKRRKDCR